jgi:hypothetical protein
MDEKVGMECGFLLPAVLEIMHTGVVWYAPDGEPALCLGDNIPREYMKLPGQVTDELRRSGGPCRQAREEAGESYLVSYGVVRNSLGEIQGYILTRQLVGAAAPGPKRAAVTEDTGLSELFYKYPVLWKDLGRIDGELSGLDDTMTIDMLRRATVGELAKSLGKEPGALATKIGELVAEYAGDGTAGKE